MGLIHVYFVWNPAFWCWRFYRHASHEPGLWWLSMGPIEVVKDRPGYTR